MSSAKFSFCRKHSFEIGSKEWLLMIHLITHASSFIKIQLYTLKLIGFEASNLSEFLTLLVPEFEEEPSILKALMKVINLQIYKL